MINVMSKMMMSMSTTVMMMMTSWLLKLLGMLQDLLMKMERILYFYIEMINPSSTYVCTLLQMHKTITRFYFNLADFVTSRECITKCARLKTSYCLVHLERRYDMIHICSKYCQQIGCVLVITYLCRLCNILPVHIMYW